MRRHPTIIPAIGVSVYTAVSIIVPIPVIINIAVVSINTSISISVMSWYHLWSVMLLGIMRVRMLLVMMRHMTVVLWGWMHRGWM